YLLLLYFVYLTVSVTSVICTLSLHDALPIWGLVILIAAHRLVERARRVPAPEFNGADGARFSLGRPSDHGVRVPFACRRVPFVRDRESTRLNSSHVKISYVVFCLQKKKKSQG